MPWADPVFCETMKKFFRVCCAREEIERCNIEVCHLFTSVHDVTCQQHITLGVLSRQGSPSFGAVKEYFTRCRCVNALLLAQIQQVFDLDGFTGNRRLGYRKGRQAVPEVGELERHDYVDGEDAEGEDADNAENDQIYSILDFVTSL